MRFRDRRYARAVTASMAGVLLVAAGGFDGVDGASAAPTSEATTNEDVTITYLASQNWVLDSEKELAEQFEAETGIHVDYQIIPADQYFSVLQTKLDAGGDGIDIF